MKKLLLLTALFIGAVMPAAAQETCAVAEAITAHDAVLVPLGETLLADITPEAPDVSVRTTASARIRREPVAAGDANVINGLASGITVSALARNSASDWFFITFEEHANGGAASGWVSRQVLSVIGDPATLPVIAAGEEAPAPAVPLTVWSLHTPADAPCGGVLYQTGDETMTALTFNDVEVSVAGTGTLRDEDDGLRITVLDGLAVVTHADERSFLVAGTEVHVLPDAALTAAAASEDSLKAAADLSEAAAQSGPVVAVAAITPPTDAEIEAAISAAFAPHGGLDGRYQRVRDDYTCTPATSLGDRLNHIYTVRFTPDAILITSPNGASVTTYSKGGDDRYHVQQTYSNAAGATRDGQQTYNQSDTREEITITAPTEFSISMNRTLRQPRYAEGYATGDYTTHTCTGTALLVWIGS